MTVNNDSSRSGRPRAADLTQRIVQAVIKEIAAEGPEGASLARIAKTAGTSQQALARRWGNKAGVLAGALSDGLSRARAASPLRSAVPGATALGLETYLAGCLAPLQGQALGLAFTAALAANRPEFSNLRQTALDHEAEWGLTLRQLLIATPFEAAMEARIDLALGYLRLKAARPHEPRTGETDDPLQHRQISELILGLIAPRAPEGRPGSASGMPGL